MVIVIYYTDFGGISNSNSNILMFKVIVIVIYYTDLGSDGNSNNILMFKVIVIVHCIVIDPYLVCSLMS